MVNLWEANEVSLESRDSDAYGVTFASLYDTITAHKEYKRECDQLHRLICRSESLECGTRLLDVGCGTGIHAIELQALGYSVTGVDVSSQMIEEAKKKESGVRFLKGDITKELGIGEYDVCISLFNVINCLDSISDLIDFFSGVGKHLKKGGLFFFEFWSQSAIIKQPPVVVARTYWKNEFEIVRTVFPAYDFIANKLRLDYEIRTHDTTTNEIVSVQNVPHVITLFSVFDIEYCLRCAGFAVSRLKSALPEIAPAEPDTRMLSIECTLSLDSFKK